MAKIQCWIDGNGTVVNIGPWPHQYEQIEVGTEEVGVPDDYQPQPDEEWIDETEGAKKVLRRKYETVDLNPIPPGVTCKKREVEQTDEGGLYPSEERYAALRRNAYPKYTPWDVLDEVLKHITPEPGSKLEEIQQQRLAVKQQYPKPEHSE